MKIICLVKFVPKVDDFKYDYKQNILIREGVPMIINPDDACALEFALQTKDKNPEVRIEIVCMGPLSLQKSMEDLLRRGADFATLISDKLFVASDTFATAQVLSTYLQRNHFDLILSGSQTLDGDTGHIGPQVGELLALNQFSNVIKIETLTTNETIIKVDDDTKILTLGLPLPALLSISKDSKYKLRFTKSQDFAKDVSQQLVVVSNDELSLSASDVGLKGSPTKIKKTFVAKHEKKAAKVFACDEEGIEAVYHFLKQQIKA